MSEISLNEEFVDEYFRDARERHAIYLRRVSGMPRPWTDDPIMQNYKITNVFRELDKTTVHLRTHVRDPLRGHPLVLPAVALYRWFTLIRSAETLFCQPSFMADPAATARPEGAPPERTLATPYAPNPQLPSRLAAAVAGEPATPWQVWLATENIKELEWPLRKQGSPWVTGSFMIRSPIGMDKLEGVLSSFRDFWNGRPKFSVRIEGQIAHSVSMNWRQLADHCLDRRDSSEPVSMIDVHEWLKNFYGLGDFLANEITSDLRYTALLDRAPDVGTFNSPGPGALRGAYLMLYGVKQGRKGRLEKATVKETYAVMNALRELSRDTRYWPQEQEDDGALLMHPSYADQIADIPNLFGKWTPWGGREPGMWLCEYVKLKRTRLDIGRPRGNYS